MPRRIAVMPEELSSRIAAGEVIERPASIVKELLENSLDAGATDITVELEDGGKTLIKIVDNGAGIHKDDVSLAFERHATSKIYTFEDITDLDSFGFRGEAIASIAAISKVEMLTRKEDSLSGTRVHVQGGVIKEVVDAGCPVGTSVTVNDIFYSTPVRMKFLKKDATEQAYCIEAVTRIALSNPGTRIKVIARGKTVFDVPRTENIFDRVSLVLGKNFRQNSMRIEGKKESARVEGFISTPDLTRSNTKGIFYYVNRRFVRDNLLNHALMNSYRWLIEPRKYPSAVLFFDLPPEDVDANVHPTKMEIRFRNSRDIYDLVIDSVAGTLAMQGLSRGKTPGQNELSDIYRKRTEEALKRYTISADPKRYLFEKTGQANENRTLFTAPGIFEGEYATSKEEISFSSLHYLGQTMGTYLIFSDNDGGIILMDQHAAHERVLFEKLRERSSKDDERQKLLIQEIISVSPGHFGLLIDNIELLADVGIEIEPYGENTVRLKSIPSTLSDVNVEVLIQDIIEEIIKTGKTLKLDEIREKIYTLFACKGAIKAHHVLSSGEVTSLCEALDSVPFATHCPHGRPLYVRLDKAVLERMFKRR
ncbi:MAG: DNA mismatch repair endonuclease MutL [Deltaproteobacteria bacterium]|nr:DNA mismatch repair endonuclease MutL [Deltaproteobacteria bacterium]MBN2845942.1 DNA mismatch repair endonuclease MutL [Deltaproteobacteria bacterium]